MESSEPYPALNSITSSSKEYLREYLMPGTGKKNKDNCGEITYANYCPTCKKVSPHRYYCKNYMCPVCSKIAAYQAGVRVADYIFGAKKAYESIGKKLGKVNHIELSVPKSEYANFDRKKYDQKAVRFAKNIGLEGGGFVLHAFRIKEEYKDLLQTVLIELKNQFNNLNDMRNYFGYWENVKRDLLGLGDIEKYIEFSPHYHFVGYFKIKEKSNEFYEKNGWQYTNITMKRRKKPENQEGVRKIFTYLLTHHAHSPGKQGVHYFGIISKNKVQKEKRIEREDMVCKLCDSQMYVISLWSEENIKKIEEGIRIIKPDDYIKKSKIVKIHYWYSIPTHQTKIETFVIDENS